MRWTMPCCSVLLGSLPNLRLPPAREKMGCGKKQGDNIIFAQPQIILSLRLSMACLNELTRYFFYSYKLNPTYKNKITSRTSTRVIYALLNMILLNILPNNNCTRKLKTTMVGIVIKDKSHTYSVQDSYSAICPMVSPAH
mmetsp:Transcript_3284/g.5293  ORF Transcript_3284/g.5293 Transcript_3284/m.5293 type:complete len:140 (+) Transcript_3284:78-497(+)